MVVCTVLQRMSSELAALVVMVTAAVQFPTFFNLNYHSMVTCLPTCQSANNPAKYPPIKSGDYLLGRFRDVQKYRDVAA